MDNGAVKTDTKVGGGGERQDSEKLHFSRVTYGRLPIFATFFLSNNLKISNLESHHQLT